MMKIQFRKSSNAAAVPDGKRIYAIGDIHGAAEILDTLLAKIEKDAKGLENAQLIFLGDYVDRGPDSKGVIERLVTFKNDHESAIFLKGNHEAAMLDFLESPEEIIEWLEWGGDETLRSYGVAAPLAKSGADLAADLAKAMPTPHLDFLKNLALTHREGDYFFVHAGIRPGIPLDDQEEDDLLWIRGRFHDAYEDERPDETIVHGHQPRKKPLDAGWRINVDTGACWSGMLSAVVLEGNKRRFLST